MCPPVIRHLVEAVTWITESRQVPYVTVYKLATYLVDIVVSCCGANYVTYLGFRVYGRLTCHGVRVSPFERSERSAATTVSHDCIKTHRYRRHLFADGRTEGFCRFILSFFCT